MAFVNWAIIIYQLESHPFLAQVILIGTQIALDCIYVGPLDSILESTVVDKCKY